MLLRLLAPTVVDFGLVSGGALRDAEGYAAFWRAQVDTVTARLADRTPPGAAGPAEVRLEHTLPVSAFNRYRTIDADALDRPLHVLTATLGPEHLPRALAEGDDPLRSGVREVSARLYDHGVLLVEALVDLAPWHAATSRPVPTALDGLEDSAADLGEAVARETVERYLDPVLAALRDADRGAEIVTRSDLARPGSSDFGGVLWVTRSLLVSADDGEVDQVVRHWLRNAPSKDGDGTDPAGLVLDGHCDHLTRWLNYVFLDAAGTDGTMSPGDRFADAWQGLRYAQYFYAALDLVDSRLSSILAEAGAQQSRWQVQSLKEQLAGLSQRAELVIMQRHDVSKYLKRSVRAEMQEILQTWDYHQLVEQPVRFKVDSCDRRLAQIDARRSARASLFTDVILLGIGVTSILSTALTLSEFGRMTSDPGMAAYDLGAGAITRWFASQPADVVLVASSLVSVVLVVAFLFFRRGTNQ